MMILPIRRPAAARPAWMPFLLLLGAIVPARSLAEGVSHADVVPYSDGTTLLTGAHDDLAGTTVQTQSVFGYDFGEDPLDPWFIGDPGFNNSSAFTSGVFPNDGKLPLATSLVLEIAPGDYGPLRWWDGVGSPSFVPVADGVEINLNRGSSNLRIGAATTGGSLSVASTGATGRIHQHLTTGIGSGGSGGTFAVQGAPDGLYAFGITLKAGGLSSAPIYFVYNVNMSETVHDEGMVWYDTHVVPEPSTALLALLGITAAALRLRRLSRGRAPR